MWSAAAMLPLAQAWLAQSKAMINRSALSYIKQAYNFTGGQYAANS
jgi:hypothetical protein